MLTVTIIMKTRIQNNFINNKHSNNNNAVDDDKIW